MKVATTIQMNREEDRAISRLRDQLGLPSKKAVVLEGVRALNLMAETEQRRRRLQSASLAVRQGSREVNREWAPFSSAVKI